MAKDEPGSIWEILRSGVTVRAIAVEVGFLLGFAFLVRFATGWLLVLSGVMVLVLMARFGIRLWLGHRERIAWDREEHPTIPNVRRFT
jgi:hypothetical protein